MPAPSKPFAIASAVNTLAALKALPFPDRAMLLLRKLIHLEAQMQSTGGLHKGNLMLPNDPYGLAAGFPPAENMPVRQHLLGAPWTCLINEGFLVDPAGSGFFSVSEEGHAAASNAENPKPRVDGKTVDTDVPTAFISYSWDSSEHKEWVLRLAERLREEGGVQVILDRWHLGPGADRTQFMEESISTSDFVLIVCTPSYATKANQRQGGVGYEAMIITSQLAHRIQQDKFIPVLRTGRWDDSSVPIWIQSKIGVDLRGMPYQEEQYELLLRALHREPLKPPPVGPKPIFVQRSAGIAANAVDAVLQGTSGNPAKLPPVAYAFYEIKGVDAKRVQVFVRPVDTTSKTFRFEASIGDTLSGTETEVAQRYLACDLELRQNGYTRMQTFDGFDRSTFRLPS